LRVHWYRCKATTTVVASRRAQRRRQFAAPGVYRDNPRWAVAWTDRL